MEFGIKKCGVLVLKRGKIAKMEGVLLPDGQVMKEIEDRGYRYLGILETDHLKEKEMKDLFSKEYKSRLKLVLKSKLSGKNKIMAANTWAFAILRYSAGVVEWKTNELKVLDRKTRKMMTLYGALHPKSDVDRVYLARQKGGRGLISCEMCVKAEENNLAWYVRNSNERLMAGVRKIKILDSEGACESIHRVKSEPESCPSPSQVESQVSSIPFFSQTTRSSSIRMASSGKREFFSNHMYIFNEFTND